MPEIDPRLEQLLREREEIANKMTDLHQAIAGSNPERYYAITQFERLAYEYFTIRDKIDMFAEEEAETKKSFWKRLFRK